ncbi:MAG TPA: aminoglycoside phosphotransferase family protein [Mycobacteriales bacterium]|nr:aminoglycoside phosphotransferase family protein [Mycobacteriales bacterium]
MTADISAAAPEIAARFGLGHVRRVEPLAGAGRRNAAIETDSGSWVLRIGVEPETLGSESHHLGTAVDVLRRERFFAMAIHERTALAGPWPYDIDDSGELLPSPYAVMPRLPGVTPWWSEQRDWAAIGTALADAASELHRQPWPTPGQWDPATDDIAADPTPAADRYRALFQDLTDRLARIGEPLEDESAQWIEEQLGLMPAGPEPAHLIHGDLVIGNVCLSEESDRWAVTGVFDLETARIGDPEEDIVGHLWWSFYGERPEAAAHFASRYGRHHVFSQRLPGYLVVRMLGNWEFGRRNHFPWYGGAQTFAEWAKPLHTAVIRIIDNV